jgi:hypothetical protein
MYWYFDKCLFTYLFVVFVCLVKKKNLIEKIFLGIFQEDG